MENESELKEVNQIKTWLREAIRVFDKVTGEQRKLGNLRMENGILETKVRELVERKDNLEALIKNAQDKTLPPSPIPEAEWQGLWRQSDTYYRPLVERLATLWGITIEM
jgi:hypothetical protein